MTPLRRRGWLLSIFSCRTPDSRERRIAKMLEEALTRAEGKPKTKAPSEEDAHEELW